MTTSVVINSMVFVIGFASTRKAVPGHLDTALSFSGY